MGLPVAVYLAPDPPGDGSLSSPWNHFLGAYLAMSSRYALKAKPLRGELRSALTARAAWLRAPAKVAPGDERIGVCATALYGGVSWV